MIIFIYYYNKMQQVETYNNWKYRKQIIDAVVDWNITTYYMWLCDRKDYTSADVKWNNVWQIKKMVVNTITWATEWYLPIGSNWLPSFWFKFIWDDRTSLTYL